MIIQALSGLMSITGTEAPGAATAAEQAPAAAPETAEPEPGSPPDGGGRHGPHGRRVRVGTSIADIVSGLYAAIGIAAALARRARTGAGAVLDLGMLDATVSVLENAIARYQVTGAVPGPLGTRHPSITPFETFATAEDEIVVAAGNDRLFATLCAVLGRDDLVGDPRFAGNAARTEHVAELKRELERALARESSAAWLQRLAAAGVPAAPVSTVPTCSTIRSSPRARHAAAGDGMRRPAGSRNPAQVRRGAAERARPPAPALGEHTEQVLAELETGHGSSGAAGGGPSVAPRPPARPAGLSPPRR